MASIEKTEHKVVTEAVELTPDYCFEQAAKALTPDPSMRNITGIEFAREWRELGHAISTHEYVRRGHS